MKYLPLIILAVLLVTAEGKAVPDSDVENQQTDAKPLQLSDYIKNAQNTINNLSTQLQEQLNLPNKDDLLNTLKEQNANLFNNVQTYLKNMTDEINVKYPEVGNLWTSMKNKVSETINLNVNPETTEQMNKLQSKFQEGVQTLVSESENAAKTISENSSKVQEGIAKFTKQAIDIAIEAAQNLNNQLQQAATTSKPSEN